LSLTNPRLEVETVGLMDLAVETAGLDEADLQPVSGLAESGEHGVVALCESALRCPADRGLPPGE
jgi:hypothetical protein